MKYGLVIECNRKYYEINGISKLPGFEHIDETKVQGIVNFTNMFESEYELINFLIDSGLITNKIAGGSLSIIKKSTLVVLPYGVSYKEDKKYFDTIRLQTYFSNNLVNKEFMEAFFQKYYYPLVNVPFFQEILIDIKRGYDYYLKNGCFPLGTIDKMEKFVMMRCRKKGKDGEYKADFTQIRDLAMFVINFERKKLKEQVEKQDNIYDEHNVPIYTVNQLTTLIEHFKNLLNGDITDEQTEAYNYEIAKLERELEYTKSFDLSLIRRKKDGTAKN